jgi:hypothetical protein
MNEELLELVKIGTLCSISTWGVTEAFKPIIKPISTNWGRVLVRLFALCFGAAFGFYLTETPTGTACGFCGAALSAVVVAKVKSKLKSS